VIVFEDFNYVKKYPLSETKPVFDLVLGYFTLFERIEKLYGIKCDKVDRLQSGKGSGIFINGSVCWLKRLAPDNKKLYTINNIPVLFKSDGIDLSIFNYKDELDKYFKNYERVEISNDYGVYIEYIYQFIEMQPGMLKNDIELLKVKNRHNFKISFIGNPENVIIEEGALVTDLNLFDTRKGPIIIKKDAQIIGPSLIQGPTVIGEKTIIDSAKVRGCFIGRVCKISGEVEESVFLDFTNKHHDGFVGHSYIGSFVNFGALATTSDLKNNYSNIKVFIDNTLINTGNIKMGCFIGDYTRLGIGTLINSGSVIGSFSNIYGGGMVPKFIPPFSWGSNYPFKKYKLDRLIEDIIKISARRDQKISDKYKAFIYKLYQEVKDEQYNKNSF